MFGVILGLLDQNLPTKVIYQRNTMGEKYPKLYKIAILGHFRHFRSRPYRLHLGNFLQKCLEHHHILYITEDVQLKT